MKIFYYVWIITGMLILINAGTGLSTPSGGLFSDMVGVIQDGDLSNVKASTFWLALVAVLALAGASVVASLFGRSPDTRLLLAGFLSTFGVLYLADLLWVFQQLISYGELWITFVATAIFAPLTLGFIISLISYWQGSD